MPTTSAGTGLRHWFRPPRHLLVLFLGTTLGFWAALGWLGWRSLQQDKDLETQRVRERIEGATDAIAVEIRRTLTDLEEQLDRLSVAPADGLQAQLSAFGLRLSPDALVVAFDEAEAAAYPRQRLLYYPVLPAASEPYLNAVVPARAYAQLATDPAGAAELFAALARSTDAAARAEALLGLARAQTKLGRNDAALSSYAAVDDPAVLVDGRPAELLARFGRCQLLAALRREPDLRNELVQLRQDLGSGRWQLTRASYLHWADQARELAMQAGVPEASAAGPEPVVLALAEGVDSLWRTWQGDRLSAEIAAGQASRVFNDQPVFLLWRAAEGRFVALVTGPTFLQDRVISPVRAMIDRQGAQVVLADGEGRAVLTHGTAGSNSQRTTLTMADTGLPWTLRVVSGGLEAELAQFSTRRQLVVAGLVFLGLFVVAGSYLTVRAMTREIEAARLKSDFVAAVSHDFRTPLTLLRQFSDLLAEGRVSSEAERRRYYGALQRGTRRLTRLVEDLLDFGRMEAGSRAFSKKPVNARACIQAICDEFQEEDGGRGYTLEVAWNGPDELVIDADEAAIGRALWNLLDNAVKYSPEHRTVWVTCGFDKGRLTVAVRDRGLGVSPDEQRAIFRKFVRGSASSGHQIKGTGLGLALVEQIVEAHGGTIRLESTVGEGSTFSVVLPARIERSPVHARKEPRWRAS